MRSSRRGTTGRHGGIWRIRPLFDTIEPGLRDLGGETHANALLKDEFGDSFAVDQIDRRGCRRSCPTTRCGEPAEGHQYGAFGTGRCCVSPEESDGGSFNVGLHWLSDRKPDQSACWSKIMHETP
jgi:hypothetical protein